MPRKSRFWAAAIESHTKYKKAPDSPFRQQFFYPHLPSSQNLVLFQFLHAIVTTKDGCLTMCHYFLESGWQLLCTNR
ncbi:hypothetical protein JXJ21_08795 [candidate division KSB1 bacterium]|nr:hypothetical protein [candidate division KSB1 bacterium]